MAQPTAAAPPAQQAHPQQPSQTPPTQNPQPAQTAQPAPAQQTQAAPPGNPSEDRKNQELKPGTSDDRLFWTLPNFMTVEGAGQAPPMTVGEKFKVVTRTSFDPVEYPYIALLAGISQAQNSEPGYEQGWAGYGKRYGAAFADNTIENYWVGAIFPTILKQDPRYFQMGKGGFWRRTGYSVSRIFITRTDSGGEQFNYSEILGSAVSAGISNIYHPAGDRTVANTMSVWGTQVGWDTVALVAKEFWPDIRRKLHKKQAATGVETSVAPKTGAPQ